MTKIYYGVYYYYNDVSVCQWEVDEWVSFGDKIEARGPIMSISLFISIKRFEYDDELYSGGGNIYSDYMLGNI